MWNSFQNPMAQTISYPLTAHMQAHVAIVKGI